MAKTTETKAPKAKSTAVAVKPKGQSKTGEAGKAKTAPTGPPRQPGVERRKNHPSRAKHGYIQLILDSGHIQAGPARRPRQGPPWFRSQLSGPAGSGDLRDAE